MKTTPLLAFLLATAPVTAYAETITGGLTLSYTRHSNEFGEMDTSGFDGRLAVDMDNGLSFGVEIGHSTMSQDGAPFDIGAEFYSIDASYRFGNGMRAGLFADRLSIGQDPIPFDITLKTNGLSFGYAGSGFDVEAFVGNTSLNIPIPLEIDNLGVTAKYTGMEGLVAGGTFLRATLSQGGNSVDMDFKGVAATYMATPRLMVFGGVGQLDIDLVGGGIDSMGLGVSYDLGASMGFASSVSLELGRTSQGGSDDLDVVRLGLTIPLGKSGAVLPMNSVADSILNPRHGAFNAGITAGF